MSIPAIQFQCKKRRSSDHKAIVVRMTIDMAELNKASTNQMRPTRSNYEVVQPKYSLHLTEDVAKLERAAEAFDSHDHV